MSGYCGESSVQKGDPGAKFEECTLLLSTPADSRHASGASGSELTPTDSAVSEKPNCLELLDQLNGKPQVGASSHAGDQLGSERSTNSNCPEGLFAAERNTESNTASILDNSTARSIPTLTPPIGIKSKRTKNDSSIFHQHSDAPSSSDESCPDSTTTNPGSEIPTSNNSADHLCDSRSDSAPSARESIELSVLGRGAADGSADIEPAPVTDRNPSRGVRFRVGSESSNGAQVSDIENAPGLQATRSRVRFQPEENADEVNAPLPRNGRVTFSSGDHPEEEKEGRGEGRGREGGAGRWSEGSMGGLKSRRGTKQLLSTQELRRASLHVKDCLYGREENFKTDMRSMRAYELYNHWLLRGLLLVCSWGMLFLTLFEAPALPIVALPYWATMIIESFFLLFFLSRVLHNLYFSEPRQFVKNWLNIVILVTIGITLVDMVSYAVIVNTASPDVVLYVFRWSRPLRPIFIVLFPDERRLRSALWNIWKTLPNILHVLVLWLSSIGLFALMAYKLLKERRLVYSNNEPYFATYWDTYWDLYVLVTTANNPDVMMPAYDFNTWFALFFVLFELVNLYLFLNIVLAVVYSNYKNHLKDEVRDSVYMQRRSLSKAFEVLKIYEEGAWFIPWDRWQALLRTLYPAMHPAKINLLLYVLDENRNDKLEKSEFLQLKDLLRFEFVDVHQSITFLEIHLPDLYNSPISQKLRLIIINRFFTLSFDVLIIANAICIAYDVDRIEWAFLSVFTLEIVAKLYAYGPKKYFKQISNAFDFTVIMSAWFVTIGQNLFSDESVRQSILDFLLILRIVRVIRIGESYKGFHFLLTTIAKILPFITTYGRVLFLLYYVYALVGMELFKGRITFHGYSNLTNETAACGNPLLGGTEFFIKRYCKNNFNNVVHSFVVLFDLMIVNQWHEISNGFIVATSKLSRLYFISFHIVCVVILLNIFAAFILEIFFLEYQLSKDKVESRVEAKIQELQSGDVRSQTGRLLVTTQAATAAAAAAAADAAAAEADDMSEDSEEERRRLKQQLSKEAPCQQVGGMRFKLQKKSTMRVEAVLQQMFENEIDPSDDGSVTDAPAPDYQPRRLTLSML